MKNIAKVVLGLPLETAFDYLVPQNLLGNISVGSRVRVSFANRKLAGFVVDLVSKSEFKRLKPVISLLGDEPVLDKSDLQFLNDFSGYYGCSLGEAIETSLPAGFKKGEDVSLNKTPVYPKKKRVLSGMLIRDISSVKRWEIFFREIRSCLDAQGTVIFLVPEAADISPAFDKLKDQFGQEAISVFNRRQSQKIQIQEWQRAKNGFAQIVIGTRSTIFAPLKNLGLIIIDEEDNSSYKQEQMPFYHARDVALMRQKKAGVRLILASSVSSIEAYHLAKKNKFELVVIAEEKALSEVQVIDMARFSYEQRKRRAAISYPLEDNIRRVLSEGGKIILFINRKGFSNIIRCRKCNFTLKCKRCDVSLTYHFDQKKLICRFCNYKIDPPQLCPECKESYLRYSGMGTEKLESEIHRLFPDKKILRLDRETGVKSEKFDILITTQIILKSNSLISADLVGVVGIDASLNRLDFRAAEKTFSLLVKLAALARKKIIIQTHNPQHYSVFSAAKMDFDNFYRQEIKLRKGLKFPPFKHFISLSFRGKNLEAVKNFSLSVFADLNRQNSTKEIEIFEPLADIPDKLRGYFRWHILLKAGNVTQVNKLIKNCLRSLGRKSGIIVTINVDI